MHILPPLIQLFGNSLDCTKEVTDMTHKRIETGTPEGDALGFKEQLFSGWLEIYNDRRLYLHYIISRHKHEGNTQTLIGRWLSEGFDVRVVMPRPIMQHILNKFQFVSSLEYLPGQYEDRVEVWYRPGTGYPFSSTGLPAGKAGSG